MQRIYFGEKPTPEQIMEKYKSVGYQNMQYLGKSNILGFTRGVTSIPKPHDAKGKIVELESKDQTKESKEMIELMKQMMVNHHSQ